MEDDQSPEIEPTGEVLKLFPDWRNPRTGKRNPERMTNPVWGWLIKTRMYAYQANQKLGGPSSRDAGPCWCFHRYGQSKTELPDGRIIFVAGEHEDHYDPDFYIYNDVVVQNPNGPLEIFGYPRSIFPPTDFHSATVLEDQIMIIGSLGYPADRKPGKTPVFRLDLNSFEISTVPTIGSPPGWIFEHTAEANDGGIMVSGGKLDVGKGQPFVENLDRWHLRLTDMRWERRTTRKGEQWVFRRADGQLNNLWRIRNDQMMRSVGLADEIQKLMEIISPLAAERSKTIPNADLSDLYRPSVRHESVPPVEDEFQVLQVHRIRVDGVIVRYVEEVHCINLICEGELSRETIDALVADLRTKLSNAEQTAYEALNISPS